MVENPLVYLFVLALVATVFYVLETRVKLKIFKYIPSIVMVYAFVMTLASIGVFEYNDEINAIYKLTKTNLLPAMIFLMLLQVDVRVFFKLGKKLTIAYMLAVFSLALGFIIVSFTFDFDKEMASAFGALSGSWMGGTANMVAVSSALGVSDNAFGYALIVDSFNYTLWVAMLLFLVPFANVFNKFVDAKSVQSVASEIGCSCTIGAKKYWLLILLSLLVSFLSQIIATKISIVNTTTTMVILATLLGVFGSFTKLKELNGSSEVSSSMLYMLIALIGSKAVFESFSGVGVYILAGFSVLLIHASIMVLGAKLFKLDLFSISVASLSNIGGVASAPILAATYNKSLVSVGVIMAILGYILGTFGGLVVGNLLVWIST